MEPYSLAKLPLSLLQDMLTWASVVAKMVAMATAEANKYCFTFMAMVCLLVLFSATLD